jgi:predicted lipid-binding transport protein (Tim44 family)
MKFWTVLLALVLAFGAMDADAARRLGGGGSIGRQSGNVTQRYSQPSPSSPSVQPQRSPSVQPAPAAPVPQPVRRPWGGILGGLAAGLGLAWLAHTLGFGEAFGHFMLFALLALVIMVLFATFRSRRAAQGGGYAYQGAGGSADAPIPLRQYNPEKVGNDASARPWEQDATAPGRDAAGGVRIGSGLEAAPHALAGSQTWGVPPGFDAEGFLSAAKRNFVTLQSAWDHGDVASLRSMMTDEMLGDVRKQMTGPDGQPQPGGRTEVVMLEAQLLGIEELATEYMASVEFSGMIREEPSAGPAPFREVWNMLKPKDGSAGWLVAGVQALQ